MAKNIVYSKTARIVREYHDGNKTIFLLSEETWKVEIRDDGLYYPSNHEGPITVTSGTGYFNHGRPKLKALKTLKGAIRCVDQGVADREDLFLSRIYTGLDQCADRSTFDFGKTIPVAEYQGKLYSR